MAVRESSIRDLVDVYESDLPSSVLVDEEYQRWKEKFLHVDQSELPDSCAKAIEACDTLFFPNIFTLLKLACTSPVTSAECKRSASVLMRFDDLGTT